MKATYFLSFLGGAAVMLGMSGLSGSDTKPPHHVYELRLYHVKEGKMEALKARFGDHTDAIFKRHNMKSIGYWSPEDAPDSQTCLSTFWSIPAGRKRRRIGLRSKLIPNGKK